MPAEKKIALLGTGAIGASIARALYLNEVPFTVLVRDKKRKAGLLTQPLVYRERTSTEIRFKGKFAVKTVTEAHRQKFDFVFLGMKTPHLASAAATAKKLLAKDGCIVLLQNGLPERTIRNFKPAQVISGIVGYNTQRLDDGSYFQSNPGHLILANTERAPHELKALLEPHLPTVISENPVGYRWNKLAINSVINGLGAVSGLALGPLFRHLVARRVAIKLIGEAAAVMRALGIKEGIVPGTISVYRLAALPALVQHCILLVLGRKYAKIRTSMLQDIEAGNKTEVGEIHGAIVASAQVAGLSVPVTSAIVRLVHELEGGLLVPDLSLLEKIP